MGLDEFKAFAEANELATEPYKRLVWALFDILAVLLT